MLVYGPRVGEGRKGVERDNATNGGMVIDIARGCNTITRGTVQHEGPPIQRNLSD